MLLKSRTKMFFATLNIFSLSYIISAFVFIWYKIRFMNKLFNARRSLRDKLRLEMMEDIALNVYETTKYQLIIEGLSLMISIFQELYKYEIDYFISKYLFENLLNMKIKNYKSLKPEGHHSVFQIARCSTINLNATILFELPLILINIANCLILMVEEAKFNKLFTSFVALFLFSYYFTTHCAIKIRSKLRTKLNTKKIFKNMYLQYILNCFEILKIQKLKNRSPKISEKIYSEEKADLKFKVSSELFRFLIRFLVFILELLIILFNNKFQGIDIFPILEGIRDLNRYTLALRNTVFMMGEYLNESKFELHQKIIKKDFKFEDCIKIHILNNEQIKSANCIIKSSNNEVDRMSSKLSNPQFLIEKEAIHEMNDIRDEQNEVNSLDRNDSAIYTSNLFVLENEKYTVNGHPQKYIAFEGPYKILKLDQLQFNSVRLSSKSCSETRDEISRPFSTSNDLFINRNDTILIHGPSGSGKSSLLKSIIHESNDNYNILIDNVDRNEITEEQIHNNISFLHGKQYLFSKTVMQNLLFGTELTEDECIKRLEGWDLLSYFKGFKNGLNTLVQNKSCGLSNGQRQVLCICRCLLKSCSIYIFDEPASFLDTEMQDRMYKILSSIKEKTVIVASKSDDARKYFSKIIEL